MESARSKVESVEHPAVVHLEQLEELLKQEKAALVVLDRDQIDLLATAKLEVDRLLQSAVLEQPLGAPHRELLQRVRAQALANQLLIVHARSCVQGVLSLLAPSSAPGYSGGRRAPGLHDSKPQPMALNFRG